MQEIADADLSPPTKATQCFPWVLLCTLVTNGSDCCREADTFYEQGAAVSTAAEYISTDAERPSIFQNWVSNIVPFGTHMTLPGLGNFPLPMEISSTAFTEAVGYVLDDRFVGVIRLELSFKFTKVTAQTRMAWARRFGSIPEIAGITGAGRFEIEVQSAL